jgi:hypothetical protein
MACLLAVFCIMAPYALSAAARHRIIPTILPSVVNNLIRSMIFAQSGLCAEMAAGAGRGYVFSGLIIIHNA